MNIEKKNYRMAYDVTEEIDHKSELTTFLRVNLSDSNFY